MLKMFVLVFVFVVLVLWLILFCFGVFTALFHFLCCQRIGHTAIVKGKTECHQEEYLFHSVYILVSVCCNFVNLFETMACRWIFNKQLKKPPLLPGKEAAAASSRPSPTGKDTDNSWRVLCTP
jgi:hypothetical protein